jgi:hypothetical protein
MESVYPTGTSDGAAPARNLRPKSHATESEKGLDNAFNKATIPPISSFFPLGAGCDQRA